MVKGDPIPGARMDPVSRSSQTHPTAVDSPPESSSPVVAQESGSKSGTQCSSRTTANTIEAYLAQSREAQEQSCRASPQPFSRADMPQGEELKLLEMLRARQKEQAAAALGRGVELCKRTVDLPGLREVGVQHHWLRTSTKEAGMGPADGGVPGERMDSPVAAQTRINDHTGRGNLPGSTCERVADVDEACVNRELEQGMPLGAWTPINQCQVFAGEVLEQCSTKVPPLPDTRRLHPGKI
jgi:hypothetical protein